MGHLRHLSTNHEWRRDVDFFDGKKEYSGYLWELAKVDMLQQLHESIPVLRLYCQWSQISYHKA